MSNLDMSYNGGMQKILLLYGGTSSEREVSLRSGNAVGKALTACNYSVRFFDTQVGLEALEELLPSFDLVFPALHGVGGEDGTLQSVLERHNIPFVASGSVASQLCFDKTQYKELLRQHDIQVPAGDLVSIETIWQHKLTQAPFVLKPFDGGSSIDTFIVRDPANINRTAIEKSLKRNHSMLLEELIVGIETTVAVLNDQALPVVEIIPPMDQEFDYENKYNGATQELCPPRNISQSTQEQLQALALDIHRLTVCQGLSRTDIMVSSKEQLYVLETNTIPGLTNQSLLPKAAAAAGITMPQLVDQLVQSVNRST